MARSTIELFELLGRNFVFPSDDFDEFANEPHDVCGYGPIRDSRGQRPFGWREDYQIFMPLEWHNEALILENARTRRHTEDPVRRRMGLDSHW